MNPVAPGHCWLRAGSRHRVRGSGMLWVRVGFVGRSPILAKESEEPESKHVKRCKKGSRLAQYPESYASTRSLPQDLVLAEKSGQGREAGNGERCHRHRPEGPGNFPPPATHPAHVLLTADGVNHRTRRQEQQAFEECMRHEVKNPRGIGRNPTRHEHIAQLGNSRIGENLLDVSLRNTNRGGVQGGECSDYSDESQGAWSPIKN